MKKEINWLKVVSLIGMGLSFVGTLVSDYASTKQTNEMIAEQVKEEIKKHFAESAIA